MEANIQIVNIEENQIPIAFMETNAKQTACYYGHGIVNVVKSRNDPSTLRGLLVSNKQTILDMYNKMNKRIVERTYDDYLSICEKYQDKYQKKLEVYPKVFRQTPMKINHLGFAYKNNTITLNSYMQYMSEETIRHIIYHELCHIYTLKYKGTFAHDQDFYDILHKEYTQEEADRIMSPE